VGRGTYEQFSRLRLKLAGGGAPQRSTIRCAAGLSSVAGDAMVCACENCMRVELIDIAPLGRGDIIVSPTVLASIEGAAAGVGWSRRIGVFNWPGSGSDASPDG
jgi:hypothetical protein